MFEEPQENLWEDPVDLTINSKNGFQHLNLFKYVCMCIYHSQNETLEYKNTLRRDKEKYYKHLDDDALEEINNRNAVKICAAEKEKIFQDLKVHQVIEDEESIDEEEERKEAEEIVKNGSAAKLSPKKKKDHKSKSESSQTKQGRVKKSKGTQEDNKSGGDEGRDFEKNKKTKENKVIFDPVLTKGGFKLLPEYHNVEIFENGDLIDVIEDALYDDYIHKGSKKFKDIFDLATLSRGDIDLVFADFK